MSEDQVIIYYKQAGGSQQTLSRGVGVVNIGRGKENDLPILENAISRQHARLHITPSGVLVEDLGSTNGTYLDGIKLVAHQPVPIRQGQMLRIAGWEIGLMPPRPVVVQPLPISERSPINQPIPGKPSSGLPASGRQALAQLIPARYNPGRLRWRIPAALYPLTRKLERFPIKITLPIVLVLLAVLVCVCVVGVSIAAVMILGRAKSAAQQACDQPAMPLVAQGGNFYKVGIVPVIGQESVASANTPQVLIPVTGDETSPTATVSSASPQSAASTPPPGEPITSLAFLEMPFPYDGSNSNFGGTDDQFRVAARINNGQTGRVNSFFDHYLPLYPASNDPNLPGGSEPDEPPIGDNILIFDGSLHSTLNYSGHPGFDFSTFEHLQPTTPVFAAADGVIFLVGKHSSGALFVKIKHTVPGVGDFLTIYWHLHPDEFYEAMLGREGQPITAGTRIGTMGNTGFSTGHHLHFEVRFDRDRNGSFPQGEAIDPFGWIPSATFPEDPWFQSTLNISNFLWKHPLGVIAQVPENGGGVLAQPGDTGGEGGENQDTPGVCAQPGSLPPGGTVYWYWAPDPEPSADAYGTGNGCVLAVYDAQGKPVRQFETPLEVVISFSDADIAGLDPSTLQIYWQEPGSQIRQALETQVDLKAHIARATASKPGNCALMGKPVADMLSPQTQISLDGPVSPDGEYYGSVVVSLSSSDDSEVTRIEYSLDAGNTWQVYEAPFTIQPGDIPEVPYEFEGDSFAGVPGTHLVLAYAVDDAGNVEDPPVYRSFSINPDANPNQVPPTPTRTPTLTPTPTVTVIPACIVELTLSMNAHCRSGVGTSFPVQTTFLLGTKLTVDGRNEASTWFFVQRPDEAGEHCWIAASTGTTSGDTACLTVFDNAGGILSVPGVPEGDKEQPGGEGESQPGEPQQPIPTTPVAPPPPTTAPPPPPPTTEAPPPNPYP